MKRIHKLQSKSLMKFKITKTIFKSQKRKIAALSNNYFFQKDINKRLNNQKQRLMILLTSAHKLKIINMMNMINRLDKRMKNI